MGRRTKVVAITAEGRDLGKVFLLRELPASRAEKWAVRALLALARAGVDLPEDVQGAGMAVLAVAGVEALGRLSFADAEPLMDEMFQCVEVCPDAANPQVVRSLLESDIDEVATRLYLRQEVFNLHTGFSRPGGQPGSTSEPTTPGNS